MYRLDKSQNSIYPLPKVRFSTLDLHERSHLQEWIAKHPQALTQGDDELLIIQKEFAGFGDTNERLDLLALDKEGNLVIIENKLDDSGRDVVWQALKYAGYCSSMSKEQIVEVFQRYLDSTSSEDQRSALEILVEFLDCDSLDEVLLNQGHSQRIILVAANFRKEVTNTALWLMEYGLRVQCIRITPYQLDNEILLDIHQVIPPPETAEYMISIAKKEKEEHAQSGELKETHRLRKKFWTELLAKLRSSECKLYNNISPSTDHWLSAGSGISGLHYSLVFGRKLLKVEFSISKSDADVNTFAYEWLFAKRDKIENTFGQQLEWLSLEKRKSCRIQFSKNILHGFSEENWQDMQVWLIENITLLEQAIAPYIGDLSKSLQVRMQSLDIDDGEHS